MTRSLKKNYEAQRIQVLSEQLRSIDATVLSEHKTARLIIEAMNEADFNTATQIIAKLTSVKGKGLEHLDAGIEQAIAELNKYTGGGKLTAAWTKLKGKVGIDNPLVKIMTFANALETGFKQMPTILKNNLGQLTAQQADQTLTTLVTDPTKMTTLKNNMLKALGPKGIFGGFKKVPYVDTQTLVADLMNVPLKNLNTVVKQIATGPQTDQIAADIKDTVTGMGGAETKGTAPGATTTGAAPAVGTTPATATNVTAGMTPTGEKTPGTAANQAVASKIYADIKSDFSDMDEKTVMSVLNTLAHNGKLKG